MQVKKRKLIQPRIPQYQLNVEGNYNDELLACPTHQTSTTLV